MHLQQTALLYLCVTEPQAAAMYSSLTAFIWLDNSPEFLLSGDGRVSGSALYYGSYPGGFTIEGELDGTSIDYSEGSVVYSTLVSI